MCGVIHHQHGPAHGLAGMFITALKSARGLFYLVEKWKGKVAKVTGVPKSPQLVRRGRSRKEASCTQRII